jgi:hypothetical protein
LRQIRGLVGVRSRAAEQQREQQTTDEMQQRGGDMGFPEVA